MPLGASLVGAVSGFGISVLTNGLRKIPLSREPWKHVGLSIVGLWAGSYWVNTQKRLVLEINEIRADKGLPPLVGSNHWVRYEVADDE